MIPNAEVNRWGNELTPSHEYVSLGAHFSTLDGSFSAEELRKAAEYMDLIKDGGVDNENRMNTERR